MTERILESDLYWLRKVFFQNTYLTLVLDPDERVLLNYDSGFLYLRDKEDLKKARDLDKPYYLINMSRVSTQQFGLSEAKLKGVLSLCPIEEKKEGFLTVKTHYVRNADLSIRWILSDNLTYPHYLRMYDGDAPFSFFYFISNYCSIYLNRWRWITDGILQITYPKEEHLFYFDSSPEAFALYMKDFFNYQGVLYQKIKKQKIQEYAKIPINDTAKAALANEAKYTHQINRKCGDELIVPQLKPENQVYISPLIQHQKKTYQNLPTKALKSIQAYQLAFEGQMSSFADLGKKYHLLKKVSTLEKIIEGGHLPPFIDETHFIRFFHQLVKLLNQFDGSEKVRMSLAHGSLHEENLATKGGKSLIFDWKMAGDKPFYWDVYQFIYNMNSARDVPEFREFEYDYFSIKNKKANQLFCQHQALDFDFYYKIFILFWLTDEALTLLEGKKAQPQLNFKLYFWSRCLSFLDH